jgi:adenylate cyclase
LAVALAYFMADKFWLSKRAPALPERTSSGVGAIPASTASTATPNAQVIPESSVAVLPFVDMSEKHDQEYFSDGIAEELLNLLSQVEGLSVPSRTSSFLFRGKNDDIASIAARLRVAHILEGSVRKADHTVRITVELIRASDGYHVWSKSFDRDFRDIFKIQDDIARAVVTSLKAKLGSAGLVPRGTNNPEAYNLGLQADYYSERTNPENLRRSVELAKQALAIDPAYAGAWARLSINYLNMAGGDLPAAEASAKARDAAIRAIESAPLWSGGHAALAYVLLDAGDFDGARREIDLVKRDEKSSRQVLNTQGNLELQLGHWTRAIELYERGVRDEPLDPIFSVNLGDAYWGAGRYADAEAIFRRLLQLSPGQSGAHGALAMTLLERGRAAEALSEAQRESDEVSRLIASAGALDRLGRRAESEAAMHQILERYGKSDPISVAQALVVVGQRDDAFRWLDKASKAKAPGIFGIKGNEYLQSLQNDPRWIRLCRELKLPE